MLFLIYQNASYSIIILDRCVITALSSDKPIISIIRIIDRSPSVGSVRNYFIIVWWCPEIERNKVIQFFQKCCVTIKKKLLGFHVKNILKFPSSQVMLSSVFLTHIHRLQYRQSVLSFILSSFSL